MNGNQNQRAFLIEILLHIHIKDRCNDKVISGVLFTFIIHKLRQHLLGVFTVS